MSRVGYLIRRVMQTIVVTLIVTIITFLLLHLVPGGEVRAILGVRATPAEIAAVPRSGASTSRSTCSTASGSGRCCTATSASDLSRNATVSSLHVARPAAHDRAGGHRHWRRPADRRPARHLPGGPPVHGGRPRGDRASASSATASPTFFVGLLLVNWFAVDLHIFHRFAPRRPRRGILSEPGALVLPVVTYAFVAFALWSRFMRSSVLDNIVQDYVRTARAEGRQRAPGALGPHLP